MTVQRRKILLANTLANAIGQLTGPLLSFLLVPLYIHYLGLESYGLIGFFAALQLVLAIFSQGISLALQRELARRLADPKQAATSRRLTRTFEVLYGTIGLMCAAVIASASGAIARHWVTLEQVNAPTVALALTFLALKIAAYFLYGLYQSIFIGSERQVLGNLVTVAGSLVHAAAGAAAAIATRNIAVLCAAEAAASVALVVAQRIAAHSILPAEENGPRFEWSELKRLWGLSAGLIWTSGTGVLITQMDRILLAKWVPATMLAVYNAGSAGGKLASLVYTPFLTAIYPETCKVVASAEPAEITRHVLRNAKIVAALCMSFGLYLCFFSPEVLRFWTRNDQIAREGAAVMSIYLIGCVAQAYASVFYILMVAKGFVHWPAWINAFSLVWYPFALAGLTASWGLAGAAASWLAYCGLTLILLATASFRHHLDRFAWIRYLHLLGWSSITGACLMLAARAAAHVLNVDSPLSRLVIGAPFAMAAFIVLMIGALGWSATKQRVLSFVKRRHE
ncbi:MAG: oligosaccharide flippase family protein [Kiritimatiellae bacterium]|nr:oligosaccharide flippase family protein [Kiritimatiellia bacterium]MDW8459013.1 oligosaccharide flippase family protein [Verrucomicrobiota bacterium]